MKKSLKIAVGFAMLVSFLGVISCSSDDNNSGSNPPEKEIKVPSKRDFSQLRTNVLDREKQYTKTTIDDNGEFTFTSKKGVVVHVSNLSVLNIWAEKGDEVECTFIELYDKGVMALANRPTMGIYPNRDESGYFNVTKDEYGRISTEGHRGFIITGGEFYFDIKVKGKQVTNYSITMNVPGKNTRGFQEDMLVWQGNVNEKDDLTFTEIPMQTEMAFLTGDEANENYVLHLSGWNNLPSEIGWSNIDKYASFEGEKTQFFVRVPQGYSYETAAVYLGVKNEEGLAHLDVFLNHPQLGNVFTEHYGWTPVGLEGYVFFISVDPNTNKVVYAIKDIKVVKNQVVEIKTEDLKTGTVEEVITLLNQMR